MRAIPRALMPDELYVWEPDDSSEYDGAYSTTAKRIYNVRFDSNSPIKDSEYQTSDGMKGVIFIDARTSKGAYQIPEGSLVSLDGVTKMVAIKVTPYKTLHGRIHHWEIDVG